MTVIVIDGPEKAGKTTLINSLVDSFGRSGIPAERVHWGKVSPDDRAYQFKLMEHTSNKKTVFIWDRCWPSEYVYGSLLNRGHRMENDPWIGEWLHGRAVDVHGSKFMVLGPSAYETNKLRDDSDIRVDPDKERALYAHYAERFGWKIIRNEHTQDSLHGWTDYIRTLHIFRKHPVGNSFRTPDQWCGPTNARVVVIGNTLSDKVIPGGWTPFSSHFTTKLGREFYDEAFSVAWTNSDTCKIDWLKHCSTVVACGKHAQKWANQIRKEAGLQDIIEIPHPSYLYRFGSKSESKLNQVRKVLSALMP